MNFRLLLCLGMGIFTTYLGMVMLFHAFRRRPTPAVETVANFVAKESAVVDPLTKEKTTYREITVTTRMGRVMATPPLEVPEVRVPGAPADALGRD
ncbi:MAG: hypothetical protein WCI46_12770 [Verrucomicrobiota bacterium]